MSDHILLWWRLKLARKVRDLVPLSDPRWAGARFVSETTDEAFRCADVPAYVDGHVHTHGTIDDWSPAPDDLVPDLDDPATKGCLLEIVREVLDPTITVVPCYPYGTDRDTPMWRVDVGPEHYLPGWLWNATATSEAAALVIVVKYALDRKAREMADD